MKLSAKVAGAVGGLLVVGLGVGLGVATSGNGSKPQQVQLETPADASATTTPPVDATTVPAPTTVPTPTTVPAPAPTTVPATTVPSPTTTAPATVAQPPETPVTQTPSTTPTTTPAVINQALTYTISGTCSKAADGKGTYTLTCDATVTTSDGSMPNGDAILIIGGAGGDQQPLVNGHATLTAHGVTPPPTVDIGYRGLGGFDAGQGPSDIQVPISG